MRDLGNLSQAERELYQRRIVDGTDLAGELIAIHEKGWPRAGKILGLGRMDDLFRIVPGLLYIVTGIPSHGKSGFVDHLACLMMRKLAATVCYFSPENLPIVEHYAHLAQRFLRQPITGPDKMTREILEGFISEVGPRFRWMTVGSESGWNVDQIIETIRLANAVSPLTIAVVDPWNEIEHNPPAGYSETQYISYALTKLRLLARELNLALFVVAHPTKPRETKDKTGAEYVPSLYDISGSAHFNNKADFGLVVWRDARKEVEGRDSTVTVHVLKCRFSRHGRKGTAEFTWDRQTGHYEPIDQNRRTYESHESRYDRD